jgi:hypothetical protein
MALFGFLFMMMTSGRAHAQGCVTGPTGNGANLAVIGLGGLVIVPPLIADTVIVARHVRHGAFWPIYGIAGGVVGVTLGLAFGIPNAQSPDNVEGQSTTAAAGFALAALGAIDVGLGLWALTVPRAPPSVAIVPVPILDAAARVVPGFAIRIADF